MRQILLLVSVFILLTSACTQKKTDSGMMVNSPFKFKFNKKLALGPDAALANGDPVTRNQLMVPSPALRDLNKRLQKMILEVAKANTESLEAASIKVNFDVNKDVMIDVFGDASETINIERGPGLDMASFTVDGKSMTVNDLGERTRLFTQLQEQFFQQRIKALEGIVSRRMILEKSKEQKVTMEEYINKNVLGPGFSVSEKEVSDFVQKNNIEWDKIEDLVKAQVKDTVLGRKREKKIIDYVAKNLITTPIEVGFQKATAKIQLPKIKSNVPKVGKGPIMLTLFSQARCKTCTEVAAQAYNLASADPESYQLSYVFSLPGNNNEDNMVAEASLCLHKQGSELFWQFITTFQTAENLEQSINDAVQTNASADFDAFRKCFLAREFQETVGEHSRGSASVGLYRQPTLVVDGIVLEQPDASGLNRQAQMAKEARGLNKGFFAKLISFFTGA